MRGRRGRIGRGWRCWPGRCRSSASPGCGSSSLPVPSCGGTVTSSAAAGRAGPAAATPDGRRRAAVSGRWCCGWRARMSRGVTAASTANSRCSALTWRRQRSGRSSRTPASALRPAATARAGPNSCDPRHKRSWRWTSSPPTCSTAPRCTSWPSSSTVAAGSRFSEPRSTQSGTVALVDRGERETDEVTPSGSVSVFAGFRFPPEVISVAVRWYLRYGLSYRDVEELLAERAVTVDHVTIYRWVQRFTPEFIEAARPCRHAPGDRWFVDETYVKVAGKWAYLYRAIDQHGQVIDVLLSRRRDLAAARRFLTRALRAGTVPAGITTDRAPAYPRVLDELIPSALHTVERYANNPIETDHGRLKARLRPMRGLRSYRSARILAAGHAFVQNLRRGHYAIATDVSGHHRLQKAFDDQIGRASCRER